MGSSSFALPALQRLFEDGHQITGVVTQPDKPSGRGQFIQSPPVKAKALEFHLPVYQPVSLKDDAARALFEALEQEMIIVVAYGKIIPPWLLRLPRYGCVNLHGSLLPKYRGAAPIHWAIANGETSTGVCTMQLDEGLDTGPVFLSEKTSIGPEETVVELSGRLAEMGSRLMVQTIAGILDGSLRPQAQDEALATVAPILRKRHGWIDWRKSAESIHNQVRAFNPWPGTTTRFRGTTCKILKTRKAGSAEAGTEPGMIVASKRSLAVGCGDSVLLELIEVQPENRRAVGGWEFANGARIQPGEKFEPVMDN